MMNTKTLYTSNLTTHDLIEALKSTISARESLEILNEEDLTLYSKQERKKLRYFKITVEEIRP